MTSDDYAYVPGNLRRLLGVLREPQIIHDFSEQDPITESLQYYNSLFINIHQSEIAEVLQQLSYKTVVSQTKYDYYYKP